MTDKKVFSTKIIESDEGWRILAYIDGVQVKRSMVFADRDFAVLVQNQIMQELAKVAEGADAKNG